MKLLEKVRMGILRKIVLGAALVGGFMAFLGAGTASARPRVFVAIGGPVVVRGYYAPPPPYWGRVYVAPVYRYGYYHGPVLRYWDARFHCWRYR
ncbi:MAG TPA: hypothetical protein VIW23_08895 [Candidatus Acidoferrum sp.]